MNKFLIILFFLLYHLNLNAMHTMAKYQVFSHEEALEVNKNSDKLIDYIKKTKIIGWKHDFIKTAVFSYKDQNNSMDFLGTIYNLSAENISLIKSGNYVYNPHGLRYTLRYSGILILGTIDLSKFRDALVYYYYNKCENNKLTPEQHFVAGAEFHNASYFTLRTQGHLK
ncbi:hypothetical protein M1446_03735 [Candidatus Dependentiae bacterium]|nr:hypothetical protein [Candidatus Dependentiae bacterium]